MWEGRAHELAVVLVRGKLVAVVAAVERSSAVGGGSQWPGAEYRRQAAVLAEGSYGPPGCRRQVAAHEGGSCVPFECNCVVELMLSWVNLVPHLVTVVWFDAAGRRKLSGTPAGKPVAAGCELVGWSGAESELVQCRTGLPSGKAGTLTGYAPYQTEAGSQTGGHSSLDAGPAVDGAGLFFL